MASLSAISEELAELDGQVTDIFRALSNGFQKLEKIKDSNRQSRQLEELTDKMRECKRKLYSSRWENKYKCVLPIWFQKDIQTSYMRIVIEYMLQDNKDPDDEVSLED